MSDNIAIVCVVALICLSAASCSYIGVERARIDADAKAECFKTGGVWGYWTQVCERK